MTTERSRGVKKRRGSNRGEQTTPSRKIRCKLGVLQRDMAISDSSSVEDEICVSVGTDSPRHASLSLSPGFLGEAGSPNHNTDRSKSKEESSASYESSVSEFQESQDGEELIDKLERDDAYTGPEPKDEDTVLTPDIAIGLTLDSDKFNTSTPTCEDSKLLQPLVEACNERTAGFPTIPATSKFVESVQAAGPVSISYHYFPWIAAYNISSCLPSDVIKMHSEGCFDIPTHTILDQFMEQYFLHVHPLLPLINEADFWCLYSSLNKIAVEPISLLVIQAMLFASSSFVSIECIKSLGFESTRVARAAFYRRAKLLYDFGTEPSHIAIAQSALLLSSWTPPSNMQTKENTLWLTIAIENAKEAGADGYAHYSTQLPTPAQMKHCNILKRVWWCCIIRDRIMPLGLRRSIQITYAHFDFGGTEKLGLLDFQDEIDHSRVYDADSKKNLIEILIQLCDLCVILTDILLLVFPQHAWVGLRRDPVVEGSRIYGCKSSLQSWQNASVIRLASPMEGKPQHYSAILYKNLLFIYYHSAWVALCHHELTCLVAAPETTSIDNQKFAMVRAACKEIESAIFSMDHSLEILNQLQLTRWLPINAVAYAAYPLALNALDIYLSASSKGQSSERDLAPKPKTCESPKIFIEAIHTLHPQYDGVDWMANIVRSAVHVVQENPASSKEAFTKWTDLLVFQPRRYLQLSIIVDMGFRNGKIPGKEDVPAHFKDMVNIEMKWPLIKINHPSVFREASRKAKKRDRMYRKRRTNAAAVLPAPTIPHVDAVTPYQSIHTSMGLDAVMATAGLTTMDPFEDLPLEPHPGLSNFLDTADGLEVPTRVVGKAESEIAATSPEVSVVEDIETESLAVDKTSKSNTINHFGPSDFLFDEVWQSYRDPGCGLSEWVTNFLVDKNATPAREMTSVAGQEKFCDPWWYFTTA